MLAGPFSSDRGCGCRCLSGSASVDIEIHQVGEPSDIGGSSRFTAGQIGKLIEVDRVSTDRFQVGVYEGKVALFVVSVVVAVLRHIAVKDLQRSHVERAAAVDPVRLAILGSSQFGVLLPLIGLEDFRGSQELQDGDVTLLLLRDLCGWFYPAPPDPCSGCQRQRWRQLLRRRHSL
jgi:hypothetical protein